MDSIRNPYRPRAGTTPRLLAGRAYWKAIHQFNLEGAYVNFMMDDEVEGRVQATYGENYKRLASVKAKYDPKNLFRVNQNILPAAS